MALEVSVAISEADPVDHECGEAGGDLVALEAAQSEVGHRVDSRGPELIGQGAHVPGAGGDVFGRPAGYPVEHFQADQFRQAPQAEHPAGDRLGGRGQPMPGTVRRPGGPVDAKPGSGCRTGRSVCRRRPRSRRPPRRHPSSGSGWALAKNSSKPIPAWSLRFQASAWARHNSRVVAGGR